MASLPQASPPTPCTHLCPSPYALHARPISFVSILKPTRWTNFSNLFWDETLNVSDSFSVHHQEFFTVHTAMVYVIQVCRQLSSNFLTPCKVHQVGSNYNQQVRRYAFSYAASVVSNPGALSKFKYQCSVGIAQGVQQIVTGSTVRDSNPSDSKR
jgi:hypothetical protein